MKKPFILSAGIPRSGSTWLFNALRLQLKRNYPRLYSCWVDDFDEEKSGNADCVLIKLHEPNSVLASQASAIFTSHRDLRDIAVSMKDMSWIESDRQWLEWVDGARVQHDHWAPVSVMDLAYENIMETPERCLEALSSRLFPNASLEVRNAWNREILSEIVNLQEASSKDGMHHPETLLHAGHTKTGGQSRWKYSLPRKISDRILLDHGDWLFQQHYISSFQALVAALRKKIEPIRGKKESYSASSVSQSQMLIIDPSLRARHGHHFNAVMRLIEAGRELGMEVTTLINKNADPEVFRQTEGVGAFSLTIYDRKSWTRAELFVQSRRLSKQLRTAVSHLDCEFDLIVAPTSNQIMIPALADLYRNMKLPKPQLVTWLTIQPHSAKSIDDPAQAKHKADYRKVFARLRHSVGGDEKLWFFSETEPLARLYSELSGISVQIQQVPNFSDRLKPVSQPESHEQFTVVCAGHANIPKGYHLLPDALKKIHAVRPDIQFRIHVGNRYSDGKAVSAIRRLREYGKNVFVTEAEFDEDEYIAWLRSGDILLLPYDPESYKVRGSGIYAEAGRLGLPTAATAGCFFNRDGIKSGRTLPIGAFTSDAIAEAVLQAPERIESLRKNCLVHANALRRSGTGDSLDSILKAIAADQPNSSISGDKYFLERLAGPVKKALRRFYPSYIHIRPQKNKTDADLFQAVGFEPEREEPRLKYIIAALGRSGSNLLVRQLLRAGAGMPGEYFNSSLVHRNRQELSAPAYWNYLLKYRKKSGIFGMKLHYEYLEDLSPDCVSDLFRDARVIMTRRRDLASQAISLEKAWTTGLWDPRYPSEAKDPKADHRRFDRLIARAGEIVDYENKWFLLFERFKITPLIVYYEDYLLWHDQTHERIFEFLGIEGRLPAAEPAPQGKTMSHWQERTNAVNLKAEIQHINRSRQLL